MSGKEQPVQLWGGRFASGPAEAMAALSGADLFVSIGTSGSVYPAAGFVGLAREAGADCLELNLEPSENASLFSNSRYGPATEIVPAWVRDILGS